MSSKGEQGLKLTSELREMGKQEDARVLSGIERIMTATPTNAERPRKLYRDMKTRVI
jgi:hypothetical protein